ncbi:MAG: cysteine--tRNA ligase [Candidatus Izemoplasmatales bacterium]|jgi:cysteinyl-tRNA synthetase|nr:cysteine--tRNA ligase [Candidatus Izemoplasmatales bacterium]
MKIFNSYTNQLEEFVSIHKNKVNMYVCGPTVYNYIHIGNARPVVFFDTVRRYFESQGYEVKYASNFTDVDDKIIQKAQEENESELVVSQKYIDAFLKDLKSLNCKIDYIQPKVTDYMNHIIKFIDELVAKDFAYKIDGDVYFRVDRISDYGVLSNRNIDDLISGSRVDINLKKESPLDFTLWKKTDVGINFESPFSLGRPGWHTECVAMIDDIFNEQIDIHGGGMDLQFPHHENEIAQSKALHNHSLARYWMHNGRLSFKNEKMSKSIGNVILVKDVEEKMPLRYFLLSTHYRSPLNYDEETMLMYIKEWQKLETAVKSLYFQLDLSKEFKENVEIKEKEIVDELNRFNEAMSEDFNTANAITSLQTMIKLINQSLRKKLDYNYLNQSLKTITHMINILGLKVDLVKLDDNDRDLYNMWQNARKEKDFEKADSIRKELSSKGIL